ncbi:hypothetical protein CBR_g48707 [Chara braunii]|uniref:Uncharacterized protein n=1 Tax=Chara braunii TaxID=69332 RepID=A0A388K4H2_CHABU|nr:hypothetical protein CBR_g48707 [Chara braunii]|eukprot:GBG64958.1 hypothetical protein CBR_g48707 [Chara braunii]
MKWCCGEGRCSGSTDRVCLPAGSVGSMVCKRFSGRKRRDRENVIVRSSFAFIDKGWLAARMLPDTCVQGDIISCEDGMQLRVRSRSVLWLPAVDECDDVWNIVK